MRSLILALATASLFLAPRPALAQIEKYPFAHIPSDFSIIVKFGSPEATLKRVEEALEEASPGMGSLVAVAPAMLGDMLGNPDMTGVDQNSDLWMAIRYQPGEEPVRVFIVPSKNPAELREAVGDTFTFHQQGRWVIYSASADDIELFKKLKSGTGRALGKFIDPSCVEILERGDLAVWVDLQSLRRIYKDDIDLLKSQAAEFIQDLPNNLPAQQGVDPQQIVSLYEGLFQKFDKALEDSRAYCGSLTCLRIGLAADNFLSFSMSSETAKQLKTLTTSDFKSLGKLPQSHLVYGGVSGINNDFVKWAMNFSTMAVNDEKVKQAFTKAAGEITSLNLGPITWSMDIGAPTDGMMQMVSQMELSEPQKLKSITRDLIKVMPEINQGGLKIIQKFKPEEETYGKYKADVISATYEVEDPTSPQGMMQQQMLNSMYGSEGMNSRTFYLEDRILQVVGGQPLAQAAIDAYEGKFPVLKKTPGQKPESKTRSNPLDDNNLPPPPPKTRKPRNDDQSEFIPPAPGQPRIILVSQLGDGGGLKIKIDPKALKKVEEQNKTPETEPAPAEPNSPPSEKTPPAKTTPEETPEVPVDSGPHELPPRDVTEALKLSRSRLSSKSNFLILLDLPAMIVKGVQRVPFAAGFGIPMGQLVDAAKDPSFTGISLAAEGYSLRMKISVPTTQVQGISKIAMLVAPVVTKFAGGQIPQDAPPADEKPAEEKNPGDTPAPDASNPPESGPPKSPAVQKPAPVKTTPATEDEPEEESNLKRTRKAKGKD